MIWVLALCSGYVSAFCSPSSTVVNVVSLKASSNINLSDLRCEYSLNPLGIDNVNPRLSWKLIADELTRGQMQSAYQVLVGSTKELLLKDQGDLWNSGKCSSDQSVNVSYIGKKLKSRQDCFWKVRVWDNNGHVS